MHNLGETIFRTPAKVELVSKLFNRSLLNENGINKLHSSTKQVLKLICGLFGDRGINNPVISLIPHKEKSKRGMMPCDLIELRHPSSPYGIAIYSNKKGENFFSVLYHADTKDAIKVLSDGDAHEDSLFLKEVFEEFIGKAESDNVMLEGPNDDPYIVVRKPGTNPELIAKSEDGDILGLIFKPTIKGDKIHGKIQFLVRERVK